MTLPLRLTLAALIVALSWIFGGAHGLVTLALYVAGVGAGVPLGFVLFGRGAAAWAAGALVGYGMLALAWSVPAPLGQARPIVFIAIWLLLLVLSLGVRRAFGNRAPVVALPDWTSRDSAALLLVLHLVPLLVGSPFARTGERDDAGIQYYRAYFTADFVWHMALTHELARFEPELKNPYVADEPMHYYWTYFMPPAVLASRGGANATPDVAATLKIAATMTALLLLTMVYIVAWAATGRRWAAMAATAIAVVAPSFEGLYALQDLMQRGAPLEALRSINIDAVSAWPQYPFRGVRVDDLPRSMWWTPQHSVSCALGLIGVLAASRLARITIAGALLVGAALAFSVTFNPLLGAAFCAAFGAAVLWDVASRRLTVADGARAALTAIPVLLGLWWCIAAGMNEGAGGLTFGLHRQTRTAPFAALFISLGAVLIPAVIGLLPSRHAPFRPAVPALAALVVGLFLMHYVTIPDAAWVGFRAGNIILVTIGMLVARGLVVTYHRSGRLLALAFAAVLFVAGLPTTVIDWYNARDLENRRMGPGFLWTVPYLPDQQAGFEWIRQATPRGAIVQADPLVRGRQNWSDIPSFTGRRMIGGNGLPLIRDHHDVRMRQVHAILTELPPAEAHARARDLGIDYLWIDRWDREAPTGASLARLFERPELFPPLFRSGSTAVLAVAK